MIYLGELIQNLKWTSAKFREALEHGDSDQSLINFHLKRGREALELSHAHLLHLQHLSEYWEALNFNVHWRDLASEYLPEFNYDARNTCRTSGLDYFLLIVSTLSLIILTAVIFHFRASHKTMTSQCEGFSDYTQRINHRLEEVDDLVGKIDRKNEAEFFRVKGMMTKVDHVYKDNKIDWHCEKVELKSLAEQMRRERDEANRMRYMNELIPVLLGARGDTPVQRLRCAIFGDIEYPIIGKERIKEFLGTPRPTPNEQFTERDANEFSEYFLPGTKAYGDVQWYFAQQDLSSRDPSLVTSSISLPSLPSTPSHPEELTLSTIEPILSRSLLDCLTEPRKKEKNSVWAPTRLDTWLSSKADPAISSPISPVINFTMDSEQKDRSEAVSVEIEDVRAHDHEPPWTPPFVPRSVQGETGWELNQYLNKNWYTVASRVSLYEISLGAPLDFHDQVRMVIDDPADTRLDSPFSRPASTWLNSSLKPPMTVQDWDSSLQLKVCPEFARIAPTLRSIFTTDQDTECGYAHVEDTVCGKCFKRVLCGRRCLNCFTAIEMVLKANQHRVAPGSWTTSEMVDTLYYQLLGLTKYPAASKVLFPNKRWRRDVAELASIVTRQGASLVSDNHNHYYNEDRLCMKCGDTHIIMSLKKSQVVLFPIDQHSYDEPRPAIFEEGTVTECPDTPYSNYLTSKSGMGRYLCLEHWDKEKEKGTTFPHLQLAVLHSLKLSGWRTKEWPWAIAKPSSDFGSWPAIFAGWRPERTPKVRFSTQQNVIN